VTAAAILQRPDTFDRVDRVKASFGEPVLSGDDRFWILGSPLIVLVDSTDRIEIPTGFTTDGASVPGWAQAITGWKPWQDPQRWAGIVHDFLYSKPGMTKRRADDIFRSVLLTEDSGQFKAFVMYWGVWVGGRRAYRGNQTRGPRIYV
jgi:hypothetical protein